RPGAGAGGGPGGHGRQHLPRRPGGGRGPRGRRAPFHRADDHRGPVRGHRGPADRGGAGLATGSDLGEHHHHDGPSLHRHHRPRRDQPGHHRSRRNLHHGAGRMRARSLIVALVSLVVAVVAQTTLFSRFQFVTPDLVLLMTIIFATTEMRRELVLLLAFLGGLVVDLLSSTVMGLRAAVFTVVGYLAIRTVHRVDLGPVAVALWVGVLTLVGVGLFLL